MKITAKEAKESFGVLLPEIPFFVKGLHFYAAFCNSDQICIWPVIKSISTCSNAYDHLEYELNPKTMALAPAFEIITIDEFNAALLATFEEIKNIVNQ